MPEFQSVKFGEIVFDSRAFKEDIVISKGVAYPRGPRKDNHELTWEEMKHYLTENTKKVIVGRGLDDMLIVSPEVSEFLSSRGVELFEAESKKAVLAYNGEQDKNVVVAVIHTTC